MVGSQLCSGTESLLSRVVMDSLDYITGENMISDRTIAKGIEMEKLRCKKHPKYQAKRVPRANCETCMQMWLNSPHRPKIL